MYAKGSGKGTIRFQYVPKGQVNKVEVAGDFSQWQPVPMKRQKGGTYVASVSASAESCEYKFLVDGKWMTDPDHSGWSVNCYGTLNSVARLK